MRIKKKIITGLSIIIISSALTEYIQLRRAEQSMSRIGNFANESIPELLNNHSIYALTYNLMLNLKQGKRRIADSLHSEVMKQLAAMDIWEEEDEKYETVVNNGDEELKLLELTKTSINGLYESGIKGYSSGVIVDSVYALKAETYWQKLSDLSLKRMRSEILEFEENKEAADEILEKTRSEALLFLFMTTLLALIIATLTARSVTVPLARLESAFEKIVHSDRMEEVKVIGNDETRKLSEAFNVMIRSLKNSFREQEKARVQLEQLNGELLEGNRKLREKTEEIETQKEKIDEQNKLLISVKTQLEESNQNLEYKVKERTRKLERAIDQLNKTVGELDRFVYSVSHDLGAPLKSVLGLVQISRYENDPKTLSYIWIRLVSV